MVVVGGCTHLDHHPTDRIAEYEALNAGELPLSHTSVRFDSYGASPRHRDGSWQRGQGRGRRCTFIAALTARSLSSGGGFSTMAGTSATAGRQSGWSPAGDHPTSAGDDRHSPSLIGGRPTSAGDTVTRITVLRRYGWGHLISIGPSQRTGT